MKLILFITLFFSIFFSGCSINPIKRIINPVSGDIAYNRSINPTVFDIHSCLTDLNDVPWEFMGYMDTSDYSYKLPLANNVSCEIISGDSDIVFIHNESEYLGFKQSSLILDSDNFLVRNFDPSELARTGMQIDFKEKRRIENELMLNHGNVINSFSFAGAGYPYLLFYDLESCEAEASRIKNGEVENSFLPECTFINNIH